MTRRRKQNGTVYRKGAIWFLRYHDDRVIDGELERKRLARQLGAVADMNKAQARAEAERFLATINNPTLPAGNAVKLVAFVENVYFPHVERRKRPSTILSYRSMWTQQLKPYCADLWTREVRTPDIQQILDSLAGENVNTVRHLKSFLSGVFRLALQQKYFEGPNPVRDTSLPETEPAEETYAYSLQEIMTMLGALPEPAATIVATAAFTGVRRGELRGMLWENYRNGEMLISRSIWNGVSTDPKTRKSLAPIPIINFLAQRLALHRDRQGNPISGPVFPSVRNKPADLGNVVERVIVPTLKTIGVEWCGWHPFRRGLATNLHQLGVPDVTIQKILRHSSVAVTQACYIKTSSDDSKAAMEKLENALTATLMPPKTLTVM